MTKIAVIEPTGIDISEYYQALPQCDILEIDSRGWSDDKLIDAIKDTDIIALSNRPLSARMIESFLGYNLFQLHLQELIHVDVNALNKLTIPIKNAAGYANTAVAEFVFGLMISLARNIPLNNSQIRHGGLTNTGTELKDKTIGIIGLGAIGGRVAQIAEAFQMQVISYDSKSHDTLEGIFSQSDYLTLHIPLTLQTKNMVNLQLLNT